jgi:predicted amidohydrolase YtcJ
MGASDQNREMLALAGRNTRLVDLARRRILPGFNDAHAHPWLSGVQQLKYVACDKTSIEEILALLHARAAETPRPLTRADLDTAVPGHPVIVEHRGGHTAYVNSLVRLDSRRSAPRHRAQFKAVRELRRHAGTRREDSRSAGDSRPVLRLRKFSR